MPRPTEEFLENKRKVYEVDFCKRENIPLLRIPYTTKNEEIKSLIEEFICQGSNTEHP